MLKTYKRAALDFDGIYVDTENQFFNVLRPLTRNILSHDHDFLRIRQGIAGLALEDACQWIHRHENGRAQTLCLALEAAVGRVAAAHRHGDVPLVPHLDELLAVVREMQESAVIVTSRDKKTLMPLLLSKPCQAQVVVSRDDVTSPKPSPEGYLKAAKILQVAPHEIIAFEDSLTGLRAAKAAGMDCVFVATGGAATPEIEATAT